MDFMGSIKGDGYFHFWQSIFSQGQSKGLNLEAKLHLVFSLMIFLSISTRQILHWLFTARIPDVSHRISHFMGFFSTESSPEAQFCLQMLFSLWRDEKRWPKAQKYIRDMTIPCVHELALQDSDRVISSPFLRVRLRTLTTQNANNKMDLPVVRSVRQLQLFNDHLPCLFYGEFPWFDALKTCRARRYAFSGSASEHGATGKNGRRRGV
ncbi:hypothetical protein B0H10DRAFT_1963486 [Mycena sp. CBHHK59/15]|nr:hypothetical protein B0H10DRAFT_1973634 [Mycena sp. CBHHK59/15]KAJ6576343.1 hypothetical protein B0H10DRAFT_1963486 [Mycena sp. CBHHK59/15]